MATLRQLRDRVKSLKNTQQITRAMKMVAGARIRRAELAMKAARPYAAAIAGMLRELAATGTTLDHPLLRRRETTAHAVLLMTADKGLCGAFNSNLVRAALQEARAGGERTVLYLVGVKGRTQVRKSPHRIAAFWPLAGKPFIDLAREVTTKVSDDFLSGAVDSVTLVSSRFVSTIVQRPTPAPLLPLPRPGAAEGKGRLGQALRNAFE